MKVALSTWLGRKKERTTFFTRTYLYKYIYIYTYIFRSCCTFLPSMWIFWPVCNWSTVIDVGKVLQSWGNPSNINWLIHRQVLREWKNSSGSSRCTRYIEGFNCRMMCPICIAHSYSMIFLLAWSFGLNYKTSHWSTNQLVVDVSLPPKWWLAPLTNSPCFQGPSIHFCTLRTAKLPISCPLLPRPCPHRPQCVPNDGPRPLRCRGDVLGCSSRSRARNRGARNRWSWFPDDSTDMATNFPHGHTHTHGVIL